MTVAAERLKLAGLKVTRPRMQVLELLASDNQQHISAEDIYKYLDKTNDSLSLATIYRVLQQLHGAGIVSRHNFDPGIALYELNDQPHSHIICQQCGQIIEFHDPVLNVRLEQIAARYQLRLSQQELYLYGRCECHTTDAH